MIRLIERRNVMIHIIENGNVMLHLIERKIELPVVNNYGALQSKTIPKILDNYGSGWVGLPEKIIIGKSSQNSPDNLG